MSENNRLSIGDVSFFLPETPSKGPLRRGSFCLGGFEFFLPRSCQNFKSLDFFFKLRCHKNIKALRIFSSKCANKNLRGQTPAIFGGGG